MNAAHHPFPCLFFFYRSGAHRDLHSFPTRRSSDLGPGSASAPPRPGRPGTGRAGTDRKSTRLNSSHRTISYAVFCLKKKKPDVLAEIPEVSVLSLHITVVHNLALLTVHIYNDLHQG